MLERWPDICGSALGFAGEAARGLLRPQFFPPALAAKVSHASSPFFSILHLQGSHHVGGGRRQEGQKGDEDHKQEGKKKHSNLLMIAFVSKVDGGETLTETTTTMSRETSGTLGTKESSGSLGREENGQPLALRSKVYC